MELRRGRASDAAALAEIEAACFPAAEAAAAEEIAARLKVYANHFYVLWDGARPVAFIDGMTTDEQDLRDEMYADASLHDAQGAWQMIFGLNTLPEYRRRGCAGRLIEALCAAAQEQGRRGVVLTCKEKLVPYYAKFGFADGGVSQSAHGGVVWHQMRRRFLKDVKKRPGSDGPGRTLRCAGCAKRRRMLC